MLISGLAPDVRGDREQVHKKTYLFLKNTRRRVAIALDEIGSELLPILSITALILGIFDKIQTNHAASPPPDSSINLGNPNLTNVLLIMLGAFILYLLVQYFSILKKNWKLGLGALGCILVLIFTNIFFRVYLDKVLSVIVVAVYVLMVIIIFRKGKLRKKIHYILPVYRILILFSLVFFVAGLLSGLTEPFEMVKYLAPSIFLLYLALALLLCLPFRARRLSQSMKIRYIALLLLGGIFVIMFVFFQINRYVILGISAASIVSFLFP
jgi:hypothetical protein